MRGQRFQHGALILHTPQAIFRRKTTNVRGARDLGAIF